METEPKKEEKRVKTTNTVVARPPKYEAAGVLNLCCNETFAKVKTAQTDAIAADLIGL
jgi:hypothetical protein